MTAGSSVAMYDCCVRLVVLKVVSSEEAEIIYDGSFLSVLCLFYRLDYLNRIGPNRQSARRKQYCETKTAARQPANSQNPSSFEIFQNSAVPRNIQNTAATMNSNGG